MKLDTGGADRDALDQGRRRASAARCSPRARTCGGCGSTAATLEGIHYLRALGNADAIRADAEGAERVVLIGGSYIACEVAASLTEMGKRCTLVMVEDAPLVDRFGARRGRVLRAAARRARDRAGDRRTRWRASRATAARASASLTESGRAVDADLVVMGTGAVPDVMLARSAGLELGETGGVRCDASLRDLGRGRLGRGRHVRVRLRAARPPAADRALGGRRARRAGAPRPAMLGARRPYDEVPYFWSDLADWARSSTSGRPRSGTARSSAARSTTASSRSSTSTAGRLAAALTVGRSEDLEHARRLIADGARARRARGRARRRGTDLSEL